MPEGGYGQEVIEMGAFAFFTKPFKLEEIEEAVDRAIARHQELASVDQSEDTPLVEPSAYDPDFSN